MANFAAIMAQFKILIEMSFKQESMAAKCIEIMEKFMPTELAKSIYAKYKKDAVPRVDLKTVQPLSDHCINLIARKNESMDNLFDIYGPATNFPIPNHLAEKILGTKCLNYDQIFKLVLLLVNNNTASCCIHNCLEEVNVIGKWEPLLWQKLALLASEKLFKFEDTTDYTTDFEDKFSLIETALPHLDKFTNLKVLIMSGTAFHDEHLVQLAQKVPNLRSLTFELDGKITNIGISALARLEKLEELLYRFNGEIYDCEEMSKLRNIFTTNCLGALPKLKTLGCDAIDCINMQVHAIPEFDRPTELALEHLKLMNQLKRSCQNSRLSNVRFLRIYYIIETDEVVQNILSLDLKKLECLILDDCSTEPSKQLISGFGRTLTNLDLSCFNRGIDFFEIIDMCPNLKSLNICSETEGDSCYQFSNSDAMKEAPLYLESVRLGLKNRFLVLPPSGAIARLLHAPNLKSVYLGDLEIPQEDCLSLIEKVPNGACGMLENFEFSYHRTLLNNDIPILICNIVTFCPKIKSVDCYGGSLCLNPIIAICSAVFKHCEFNF